MVTCGKERRGTDAGWPTEEGVVVLPKGYLHAFQMTEARCREMLRWREEHEREGSAELRYHFFSLLAPKLLKPPVRAAFHVALTLSKF